MRIIKESSLSHMEKHDTGLISASRNMFSSLIRIPYFEFDNIQSILEKHLCQT